MSKRFVVLMVLLFSAMYVFADGYNSYGFSIPSIDSGSKEYTCYFSERYVGEAQEEDIPIVIQNFNYLDVFICDSNALKILKRVSVDGKGFSLSTLSVKLPCGEIGYDFNPKERNISIRMMGNNVMIMSGRDAVIINGTTGYLL